MIIYIYRTLQIARNVRSDDVVGESRNENAEGTNSRLVQKVGRNRSQDKVRNLFATTILETKMKQSYHGLLTMCICIYLHLSNLIQKECSTNYKLL